MSFRILGDELRGKSPLFWVLPKPVDGLKRSARDDQRLKKII
jgi:hypothetical protein